MTLFAREKLLLHHPILRYQINLYFSKYKSALEVDEKGHIDRDEEIEIERQKSIKMNTVVSLLELILTKRPNTD